MAYSCSYCTADYETENGRVKTADGEEACKLCTERVRSARHVPVDKLEKVVEEFDGECAERIQELLKSAEEGSP